MKRAILIVGGVFVLLIAGVFIYRHLRAAKFDAMLVGLEASLEEDTLAYEREEWPRPPVFGEAVPGTAWEHYRAAHRLYEEIEMRECPTPWGWLGPGEPLSEEFRSFAESLVPVADKLIQGAATARAGRHGSSRRAWTAWSSLPTIALRMSGSPCGFSVNPGWKQGRRSGPWTCGSPCTGWERTVSGEAPGST